MKLIRDNVAAWGPGIVFVLLYLGLGLHFPSFFGLEVFSHMVSDNGFVGVVAVGLTFVILTGGIDLSVGSIVGLGGVIAATLIQKGGFNPPLAILIVLAVGTAIGFIQGLLIAKLEIAPFLVTLGGLFFARGLTLWITKDSIDIENRWFRKLADYTLHLPANSSVDAQSITLIALIIVAVVILKFTTFGRTLYAIGGGKNAAKLMGLSVDKSLIGAYSISGFCAGLGGVLYCIYTSSGNNQAGLGLELDAIAAVVIGGTLLSGGYGSVLGTGIGILILGTIQEAITFQGTLSSWWTKIFIGVMLLVFMLLQKAVSRLKSA